LKPGKDDEIADFVEAIKLVQVEAAGSDISVKFQQKDFDPWDIMWRTVGARRLCRPVSVTILWKLGE
jgi:hypothetical protein